MDICSFAVKTSDFDPFEIHWLVSYRSYFQMTFSQKGTDMTSNDTIQHLKSSVSHKLSIQSLAIQTSFWHFQETVADLRSAAPP